MDEAITINNSERYAFATQQLQKILLRHMPSPGVYSTPFSDVGMARFDESGISEHRFDRPLASFLAQGSKEIIIGEQKYKLKQGQILTVCVDMASSSKIVDASSDKPFLTFFFHINPAIIKELLIETSLPPYSVQKQGGVSSGSADTDFVEAMLRLATLLEKPQRSSIRVDLAVKDLHFLLLTGQHSEALRHLYGKGGNSARLFRVISFMKKNLNRVVKASELAKISNMSESSLFRHFKDVTGLSPLQYHKQLRLHQARNLMLSSNEQVSTAAYSVGYESISQFNREYKKLFGETPGHSKIKIS